MLCCIFVFLILSLRSVCSYNLEFRLPLYKKGPDGSKFGFSVAMHKLSSNPQGKSYHLLDFVKNVTSSKASDNDDLIHDLR